MKIAPEEIEYTLGLSGEDRYYYFLRKVVALDAAWGLYDGGWALAEDNEGTQVFPLWPAREYAALSAVEDWFGFQPKKISLDELIDDILPDIKRDGIQPGIFFIPSGKGVVPPISAFADDLADELNKYDDDGP